MSSRALLPITAAFAFVILAPVSSAASIAPVTFNFSPVQPGATASAELASIEIAGATYFDFIVPDDYANLDLNGTAELRMDTVGQGVNPGNETWEALALAAFQSGNLNHYQQLDAGNLNSTWKLGYGNGGIAADANLFLVVTERNGNNPFIIEGFDAANNSLGVLNVPVTDYIPTGAVSLSTDRSKVEDIHAAVYRLSDLVAPGSANLASIEITNNFTTEDGGDGKVFFFGEATLVPEPSTFLFGLLGLVALNKRRR
ncbi:MAG: PEP-CTERM sorting domain-containing protein [Verrucomicrobiota bacterium]